MHVWCTEHHKYEKHVEDDSKETDYRYADIVKVPFPFGIQEPLRNTFGNIVCWITNIISHFSPSEQITRWNTLPLPCCMLCMFGFPFTMLIIMWTDMATCIFAAKQPNLKSKTYFSFIWWHWHCRIWYYCFYCIAHELFIINCKWSIMILNLSHGMKGKMFTFLEVPTRHQLNSRFVSTFTHFKHQINTLEKARRYSLLVTP